MSNEGRAKRLRGHFRKLGLGTGPLYPPDSDDNDPDDWKFWVYSDPSFGKNQNYKTYSVLGEVHVSDNGVHCEGESERKPPSRILQDLLRHR